MNISKKKPPEPVWMRGQGEAPVCECLLQPLLSLQQDEAAHQPVLLLSAPGSLQWMVLFIYY